MSRELSQPLRIATIGECMMELQERPAVAGDGVRLNRTFGGDAFNTAVYLRRSLRSDDEVQFVTAVGDDPFSAEMRAFFKHHGVGTEHVLTITNGLPGLYFINTDAGGERRFYYWREQSAARRVFQAEGVSQMTAALLQYDLLYFTGISLAILSPAHREGLLTIAQMLRDKGGRVAFDPNFRAVLWPDRTLARTVMQQAISICDIGLPGFEDEQHLYGDASPADTARRWRECGSAEVVVKTGANSTWVASAANLAGNLVEYPQRTPVHSPVDTTAAGDAFNAAYIAARLLGKPVATAIEQAQRLAAHVIRHPGAIAPPLLESL